MFILAEVFEGDFVLLILYRVVPNTIRVIPTTIVTFVVYENTKIFLPTFFNDQEMAHEED